jgi:predicted hydrocarbon binding protein
VIAYVVRLRTSPISCPVTSISYFEIYAETLSKKVMSNNAEKVSYKVAETAGHKTGSILQSNI